VQCTRIALVRHGQTTSNGGSDHPVLSGVTDLPLTDLGHQQALAVARSGAVRDADPVMYASTLQRARVTAGCIARASRRQVVCRRALQEIDCGQLDGIPIDVVRTEFAGVWAASQSQADDTFRWPGGESYADVRERSVCSIAEIASSHPGARVLVVTHAGVITQLIGHILGTPPAHWSAFRPGNASITEIDWDASGGRLVSFDCREHLPPALRT
jgi:alpha-ribazole phosphatase/probable phosphoglycerate mutase